MKISLLSTLALTLFLAWNQIQYSELIGSWQLVHFDGIEKIVNSDQYQNATPAQRASIESRIQTRLENTVYEFVEGDTLKYIDMENQVIVQKESMVELQEDSMLVIHSEKGDRLAKIVELTTEKLVLQPISVGGTGGKLTFERIKK